MESITQASRGTGLRIAGKMLALRPRSALFRTAGVTEDGLQLKEFFQAGFAPFAAVARLFVASEATGEVDAGVVDVDVAGAKSLGDAAGVFEIS